MPHLQERSPPLGPVIPLPTIPTARRPSSLNRLSTVIVVLGVMVLALEFAFLGTSGASSDDVVQRSDRSEFPVSFDEAVELARVPGQESDLSASRSLALRPAEHLLEQVTVQTEATDKDSPDLTWSEAKEHMRTDFVLTTASEETLREIALTLDGSEDPFDRFVGDFDLSKPEAIDWSSQIKLGEGEVLSEQEMEDLAFVASEYKKLLSTQSNAMVKEFEAALLMYKRRRRRASPARFRRCA